MVNDPIVADVYPRIGTPLHVGNAWFGHVIISARKGYYTPKKYNSPEEADAAAKELLKYIEVKQNEKLKLVG